MRCRLLRPLKKPCKSPYCGAEQVYQKVRPDRVFRRLARAARATSSRRSGSAIADAADAASERTSDGISSTLGIGSRGGLGRLFRLGDRADRAPQPRGCVRTEGRTEAVEQLLRQQRELLGPRRRCRRHVQRAVPPDSERPGVARDRVPDDRRATPPSAQPGESHRGFRSEPARARSSLRAAPSPNLSRSHRERLRRFDRQRGDRRRRDHRL